MLVNKCRTYDEDSRARSTHYNSVSDKHSGNQNRRNLYVVLYGKCKQTFQRRNNGWKSQNEGGPPAPIKCFKCGMHGHRASKCTVRTCFKCGKA